MLSGAIARIRLFEFSVTTTIHTVGIVTALVMLDDSQDNSQVGTITLITVFVAVVGVLSVYMTERREREAVLTDYQLGLTREALRASGEWGGSEFAMVSTTSAEPHEQHVFFAAAVSNDVHIVVCVTLYAGRVAADANTAASTSRASLQRYESGIAYICHEVRS